MNVAIACDYRGVLGVSKYTPPYIRTNEEVERIFAQNGVLTDSGQPITAESIEKLVDIKERHLASPDQDTSELAFRAGASVLCKMCLRWEDMNVCMVGSSSHVNNFPGTVHHMLNRPIYNPDNHQIHPEATDISVACSSGVTALIYVARALLCEPDYEFGMAIGAETIASRMATWKIQNDDLWGDGAGAWILEKTDKDRGFICADMGSDAALTYLTRSVGYGTHIENSLTKEQQKLGPFILVEGHEVHRYVIDNIHYWVNRLIAKANSVLSKQGKHEIAVNDLDLIITHQANGKIYHRPAKKLKVPETLFYNNIAYYGNTSAASIPIAMTDAIEEGRIGPGSLVALVSFGGGMGWASSLWKL